MANVSTLRGFELDLAIAGGKTAYVANEMSFIQFEEEVTEIVEGVLVVSRSDAQAIVESMPVFMRNAFASNTSAPEASKQFTGALQ